MTIDDEYEDMNEFPEDEVDYYLKLLQESNDVGLLMINNTNPQESEKLTQRHIQLQKWLDEISFNNAWEE
jgi:hypothetical protein